MKETKVLYRVLFTSQESTYELFAYKVSESALFGFIELEDLVFSDHSGLVLDPSEERLRYEFKGVKRSYIPVHEILRIDEIEKKDISKIRSFPKQGEARVLTSLQKITTSKPIE